MSNNVARGAILVVIASLVGAFVLWSGFDLGTVSGPSVDVATAAIDEDPDAGSDATDDGSGDVAEGDQTDESGETPTEGDPPAEDETIGEPVPSVPATSHLPADVKVIVANGAQVQGAATRISDALSAQGYVTLAPTNADQKYDNSVIYYAEDYQADAAAIGQILNASGISQELLPTPVPGGVDLREANVYILLGGPDSLAQPG